MGVNVSELKFPSFCNSGTYFRIELDSANYEDGAMVTGKLHFDLTNKEPRVELFITLVGHENVLWHEKFLDGNGTGLPDIKLPILDMHLS